MRSLKWGMIALGAQAVSSSLALFLLPGATGFAVCVVAWLVALVVIFGTPD